MDSHGASWEREGQHLDSIFFWKKKPSSKTEILRENELKYGIKNVPSAVIGSLY